MANNGWRDERITFEIVEHIGVFNDDGRYTKEVNLVSWCGKPAKVDIRSWNEDHTLMTKGITLTEDEAKKVCDLLKARYE